MIPTPEQIKSIKKSKLSRREQAYKDFCAVEKYATNSGMRLKMNTFAHYQLIVYHPRGQWIYNLYPGNRRIYKDKNHSGPFLDFEQKTWTLIEVIQEAIKIRDQYDWENND